MILLQILEAIFSFFFGVGLTVILTVIGLIGVIFILSVIINILTIIKDAVNGIGDKIKKDKQK